MSFTDRLIAGLAVSLAMGFAVRFAPAKTKIKVKQWIYSGRLQSFLLLTGVAIVAALLIQQVIIRVFY